MDFPTLRLPFTSTTTFPAVHEEAQFICYSRATRRGRSKRLYRFRNPSTVFNGISIAFWQGDQTPRNEKQEPLGNTFRLENHTLDYKTPRGSLSPAAVYAIEQFSRLNGLTGKRMQEHFERYAPVSVQNEAQNLLEFCCFRYMSRGSQDFSPALKNPTFRRLTFIAMLGWQHPYAENQNELDQMSLLVYEAAFVRIAPSLTGAADRATVHHLYKALKADKEGLSFDVWNKYLSELCSILKAREDFRKECKLQLDPDESLICVGASSGQPVQKWDKGIVWPGNLVMTDRALYFEPFKVPLKSYQTQRLGFSDTNAKVERKKVGPLGVELFDSAISVSSSSESETWLLEFVDFSGKGRREFWFSYIQEMIAAHSFVREYAPKAGDSSMQYAHGSRNGRTRAVTAALLGIARLQALQATLKSPPKYPERLLQFSYLSRAPGGFLVLQTLAVDYWGGRMELNSYQDSQSMKDSNEGVSTGYVVGTDGSIYYRRWMVSETWKTAESVTFWKQRLGVRGLVLGKNHVVGGQSHLERAVEQYRELSLEIELTKATIDGAIIAGIPENIDLLKELIFPLHWIAMELKTMREWREPPKTVAFLLCFYVALYKKVLRYVFPCVMLMSTVGVFAVRGLRASGRLEPDFGKVTIKEQPPSNTIQKIISLKEALAQVESSLQEVNVCLLKLRTLALSSNTKATNVVLFCLIAAAAFLLTVPFRVALGLFVLDQFTMELEFRKPMVREFVGRISAWWESVPAAPVVVEPFEKSENSPALLPDNPVIKTDVLIETLNHWFGDKGDSA